MAHSLESAVQALHDEIRRQLKTWNHRPAPIDEAAFEFPDVGSIPSVQHNDRPLFGRSIEVGTFGRSDDCEPSRAAEWRTHENRERYALHCQKAIRVACDAILEAARSLGQSASLIEPLKHLRRVYDDFLRAALIQEKGGLFSSGPLRYSWQAIYPAADNVCELIDELIGSTTRPLGYDNCERDRFIYPSRCEHKGWKWICSQIARHSEWDPITSPNSMRDAAIKYARTMKLANPPAGTRGRRPKSTTQ